MELAIGMTVLDARSNKELKIVALCTGGIIAEDQENIEYILTVGYTTYLTCDGQKEIINV